jgi:dTDP-4-amino-4,6-dideoxygalactose transaminase
MIPFSPPRIDQAVIDEVTAALQSGWITTGPRTKQFEKEITAYCGSKTTIAVSAWTTGMEVLLRWWGVGPGDEVIIPVYTYCASANVVLHTGATPVFVDVNSADFNLSLSEVAAKITSKTKVIMPVDLGGFPCDYKELYQLIEEKKHLFEPNSPEQAQLGRILLAADAAHSFGALHDKQRVGSLADITVFSFHAVKNLTTAEGGAITFNLPEGFDHDAIYKTFNMKILHGQSKDALAKTQKGAWRYDVLEPGYKCNMTDIQAAIGLIELGRYQENLDRRQTIFAAYDKAFSTCNWAQTPIYQNDKKTSSYHLYQLRINNCTEAQRDAIIQAIFDHDVAVNVHFLPLPLLTAYKNLGYDIADFPNALDNYSREISLPVYYDLNDEQVATVIEAVCASVHQILGM